MKNDLAKQDIKFAENSDIVDNLNKGTFTINQLSENSYYKGTYRIVKDTYDKGYIYFYSNEFEIK